MAIKLYASALLFDMDGTLVNSNAAVERAWAFWARRHNLDLPELLRYSHGRPTIATMNYFGERFAPENDWTAEADEMQRMEENDLSGTQAIAGAHEILSQLEAGSWAVVTSAPRELAETRITSVGLPLPPLLVPVDEITYGKPHPEGYLTAAHKLGVAPAECIVFEDTPPGVEAGLSAGMQVIGLLTTVTGDRLRTNYLIRNYRDLQLSKTNNGFEIVVNELPRIP